MASTQPSLSAADFKPPTSGQAIQAVQYAVPYFLAFLVIAISAGIYVFIEMSANLADIGNNWPEYRCKPHVMPMAGLFGHDMNENFQFCIQQIIQENTKGTTAPFAAGISGFTGVLGNLMSAANSFRATLATMVGGIIKIIAEFKTRMTALMGRVKLTVSRMKAMMFRIYGTMFAVMYMGMSAQTGIANFGDTFIFKFIDAFCFAPDTKIIMANMTEESIQNVKVGQTLHKGAIVEAVIECPGSIVPLYNFKGIYVSGRHRVWSDAERKFISVKDHPEAVKSTRMTDKTWTLITSTREIPVRGADNVCVRFADWEELPSSKEAAIKWDALVNKMLNGVDGTSKVPNNPPCIEHSVLVYKHQGGLIPISEVVTGDWVQDKTGWSQVIGICKRYTHGGIGYQGARITDGLWIYDAHTTTWKHPERSIVKGGWIGHQLITTSGSFMIHLNNEPLLVRDFTEVGYRNLEESYDLEDSFRF